MYRYQKGDYESMRAETLKFAKERYLKKESQQLKFFASYDRILFKGKPASNFVLLIVPSRYFCSGSFCFMSWCLKFFVLLAPYVCFHIFS